MPLPGTRGSSILAGLALFLLVESLALAGGSLLRDRLDGTRVVLIGSGRSPSVLVTAGDARLLLAAGDDPAAFGNGWRRWIGPLPARRVDVLLLAGGDDGAVAAATLADLAPRWIATIGAVEAGLLRDRPAPPLATDTRFRLTPDLSVTVERRPTPGGEGNGHDDWRMLVERDRTVVAVVPDGAAATRFNWSRPVAALIVLRGDVAEAVATVQPRALIVAQIVTGRTLRSDLPPVLTHDIWTYRIPPGEIARLDFVDAGLRIPDDADPLTSAPAEATPAH
jgi:hypothetical protein